MPDQIQQIDISRWVDRVKGDNVTHLQRQATEVILHAIAMEEFLSTCLYLKGGVLMGLVYASP